jgi:hypothetical protein
VREFLGPGSYDSPGIMDGETRIEDYFHKHAMNGIILSHADLLAFAKKKKIPMTPALSRRLRHIRYRWKFTAAHSQPRKPSHFMGFSILNYGLLMVDMGFYNYFKEEEEPERKVITRSTAREQGVKLEEQQYGGKKYLFGLRPGY